MLFKNKSVFFNHFCKNKITFELFLFKKIFSPTTLGAHQGLKIPSPARAKILLLTGAYKFGHTNPRATEAEK
jgi:hypothetical protein